MMGRGATAGLAGEAGPDGVAGHGTTSGAGEEFRGIAGTDPAWNAARNDRESARR
jgi:hypothetical protein